MEKTNTETRQILFAHSAGSQYSPGEGSFNLVANLQRELSREYHIHYPIIDDPEAPTYQMWKKLFSTELSRIDQPLILIGHSLGGSTLLKYLSEEKPKITVYAMFLIATPHWGKNGWDVEDFLLQENFEAELRNIPHVYLYHCQNDPVVPFQHLEFYKKAFPDSVVRELKGKDHAFENGLPELVSDIKALK